MSSANDGDHKGKSNVEPFQEFVVSWDELYEVPTTGPGGTVYQTWGSKNFSPGTTAISPQQWTKLQWYFNLYQQFRVSKINITYRPMIQSMTAAQSRFFPHTPDSGAFSRLTNAPIS